MSGHDRLYEHAEIYDIAFDFREIDKECDFLQGVFEKLTGRKPTGFLELAAGPALHAREFAHRGLDARALDVSPAMVQYGLDGARKDGVKINYVKGDMTEFSLDRSFDIIAMLMDSASYLLDNEAVLANFHCAAEHLTPDGIYVLEMSHPREVFKSDSETANHWTMQRGDITVKTRWGAADDEFDPITQITQTTVTMTVSTGDSEFVLKESAPQRCFTATEFDALVRASGKFTIAALYGSMDVSVPFDNSKAAWRMVPILRKL